MDFTSSVHSPLGEQKFNGQSLVFWNFSSPEFYLYVPQRETNNKESLLSATVIHWTFAVIQQGCWMPGAPTWKRHELQFQGGTVWSKEANRELCSWEKCLVSIERECLFLQSGDLGNLERRWGEMIMRLITETFWKQIFRDLTSLTLGFSDQVEVCPSIQLHAWPKRKITFFISTLRFFHVSESTRPSYILLDYYPYTTTAITLARAAAVRITPSTTTMTTVTRTTFYCYSHCHE